MRTIIVLFFFTRLTNFGLFGQIKDPNFSDIVFTSGDCLANVSPSSSQTTDTSPFVACSFKGWSASHGTPEIYSVGGNTCAAMWSGDWHGNSTIVGEGLYANCWFTKGKTYHLTMLMKSSFSQSGLVQIDNFISKIYIKLATVLPIVTTINYSGSAPLYSIPSVGTSQTIWQVNNFSSPTSFQTVDFYFTANDDYVDLWIYPEHNNGQHHVAVLVIDAVVIEDCIPDVTYSNNTSLPALTLRSDYIKAINGTQVLSGQNVKFSAGNYINLDPDFSAVAASEFTAVIGGCEQLLCGNPNNRMASEAGQIHNIKSHDNPESQISIYPNPNSGFFTINVTGSLPSTISVEDLMGKILIKKEKITEYEINLDISEMAMGVYLIKIQTGNKIETRKIVKQ